MSSLGPKGTAMATQLAAITGYWLRQLQKNPGPRLNFHLIYPNVSLSLISHHHAAANHGERDEFASAATPPHIYLPLRLSHAFSFFFFTPSQTAFISLFSSVCLSLSYFPFAIPAI